MGLLTYSTPGVLATSSFVSSYFWLWLIFTSIDTKLLDFFFTFSPRVFAAYFCVFLITRCIYAIFEYWTYVSRTFLFWLVFLIRFWNFLSFNINWLFSFSFMSWHFILASPRLLSVGEQRELNVLLMSNLLLNDLWVSSCSSSFPIVLFRPYS